MQHRRAVSSANNLRYFRPAVEALEDRLCLSLAVPSFSSLPGANHTIYLDFDGHVTQGTEWNNYFKKSSVNSPAYDIDGDPNNFSATELARIENIWKRVAEDFIPFQVNVTTVDPGLEALRKTSSTDAKWGVRVVITRDTEATNAGGIGYIGSFNWNTDTPVFVYNTSEIGVAEAASHEVGHSLYLAHDGTATAEYYTGHGSGETGWAPIMGAGYYKNVTQWDRGEYTGADNVGSSANYGRGPDDLFVITNYNGFGYRVDDHGNTSAAATAMAVSGTNLSGSGIIERTTDKDVFSFTTTGGAVSLNIEPFRPGPNLDVRSDLYNSSGTLIATSNSTSSLSASFNLQLAAGSYYLHIDGIGVGSPSSSSPTGYSDYASLGRYTITGTANVTSPTVTPAHLSIAATSADKGEGNSGTTAFTFTVTRTGNTSIAASASYSVVGSGTNPATASDFNGGVLPTGTVSFSAGQTSRTITIYVRGDRNIEPDETFTVTLSNPSNNTQLAIAAATGIIREDDIKATLQITGPGSVLEGTSSTPTAYIFTVTRSGSLAGTATVQYVLAGVGTTGAAARTDFVGGNFPSGTITFQNGETSKQVTILIAADSIVESNEIFSVTLRNQSSNATIAVNRIQVTITNDDGAAAAAAQAQAAHSDHDEHEPHLFLREPEELRDLIPAQVSSATSLVKNYLNSSEFAALVERVLSHASDPLKQRIEQVFADFKNWWR